jgi:hypothetical protein
MVSDLSAFWRFGGKSRIAPSRQSVMRVCCCEAGLRNVPNSEGGQGTGRWHLSPSTLATTRQSLDTKFLFSKNVEAPLA